MLESNSQKAILFADISGSSALYKSAGNQKAKEIVDFLLDAMRQLVTQNDGAIIKSIGDEIMTCFERCQNALVAASAMQHKFSSLFQQHGLSLSIGIGYGELILDQADIFGEAVNDAAYLTHLAKGGQILITEGVFIQLDESSKNSVRVFDKVTIKGAQKESIIYRVFWQQSSSYAPETRFVSSQMIADELALQTLKVRYKNRQLLLTSEQMPFAIGRDQYQCNLVVNGNQVSREHCVINFSRGKFVIVDHSTNGCYITSSNEKEFYIRREEYPLVGTTILSLGAPGVLAGDELIELIV